MRELAEDTGCVLPVTLLVIALIAGCTASGSFRSHMETMVGKVYIIGNEPFTKYALQLEDGNAYVLNCSKELQIQLARQQGKTIKIHFNKMESAMEGMAVTVVSIDALEK
jgi:hypothetical protein